MSSGRITAHAPPTPRTNRDRAALVLHVSPDTRSRTEQELLARIQDGDRDAFGTLVQTYLPRSMSLAMRVLRHREDAEDLVQDAFLSALQHIDTFDATRPFWPWLSRIIMNRGLDLAASRAVRAADGLAEDLSDSRPSPADAAEQAEIESAFRNSLDALPPRRRLVVQLFQVDGFSVSEIAAMLEAAPATIRWHLHIARRHLRTALARLRGGG